MANEARFEVYKQKQSFAAAEERRPVKCRPVKFGWRFRAANGQISAVGGEGFTRKEDAMRACIQFCRAVGAPVSDKGIVTMPAIVDVDE